MYKKQLKEVLPNLNMYILYTHNYLALHPCVVAWPSGLRRWFKAPVSSEAWVQIPPLPKSVFTAIKTNRYLKDITQICI